MTWTQSSQSQKVQLLFQSHPHAITIIPTATISSLLQLASLSLLHTLLTPDSSTRICTSLSTIDSTSARTCTISNIALVFVVAFVLSLVKASSPTTAAFAARASATSSGRSANCFSYYALTVVVTSSTTTTTPRTISTHTIIAAAATTTTHFC